MEIEGATHFGGTITTELNVASPGDLPVNGLFFTTDTLNVTTSGDLKLGFVQNFNATVNLESHRGLHFRQLQRGHEPSGRRREPDRLGPQQHDRHGR